MLASEIRRDVQSARALSYWLLRRQRLDELDALESELLCIEGALQDATEPEISDRALRDEVVRLEDAVVDVAPLLRPQVYALLRLAHGIERKLRARSRETAADRRGRAAAARATRNAQVAWAMSIADASTVLFARTPEARTAGAALAAARATALASAASPTARARTALAWGAAAILAPFVLGYFRRDPLAAAIHVASGIGTLAERLVASPGPTHIASRPAVGPGVDLAPVAARAA